MKKKVTSTKRPAFKKPRGKTDKKKPREVRRELSEDGGTSPLEQILPDDSPGLDGFK